MPYKHQEFGSSAISAARYFSEERVLFVVFTSGRIYRYSAVPSDIFDGLLAAESAGKYFNRFILNEFEYVEVFELPE